MNEFQIIIFFFNMSNSEIIINYTLQIFMFSFLYIFAINQFLYVLYLN